MITRLLKLMRLSALLDGETRTRVLGHGLFWSWNLLFLSFVILGLWQAHLSDVLAAALDGDVPPSLALGALFLLSVPLASTAIGLAFFRRQPAQLLRLFYGAEAPLFFASLLRVFLLRELTPAQEHLLVAAALALIAFGYGLAFPRPQEGRVQGLPAAGLVLRLGGASLGLLGAVYFGALLAFYVVPLGWFLLKGFFAFDWARSLWHGLRMSHGASMLLVPLGALLFVYSASLLCLLPLALPALYVRHFLASARDARRGLGAAAALVPLLVIGGNVALFVHLSHQPQREALQTLSSLPQNDGERQARLARSERLRQGLLNAYLSSLRYLGARGSADHIEHLYGEAFHLPRALGARLQRAHDSLASPLLYDGASLGGDRGDAERLYADFFDAPIQKGERLAVRAALSATYERGRREAGLLSVDDCRVRLVEQTLRLEPAGDAAEIELQEVYENQTTDQQEVFYYFSLPEGAVPTGLWLGEEGGPRQAFAVAPRGAAQKVYQGEVRRRRDPALLEQIGPRQYRLRAFPIPPRPRLARGEIEARGALRLPAPRFHLWLRVAVLAAGGAFPLPTLGERRGVCWDGATRRVSDPAARWPGDAWLPATLPAPPAAAFVAPAGRGVSAIAEAAQARRFDFTLGAEHLTVRAQPEAPAPLPPGRVLAIVVDRSYSMGRLARDVAATIDELRRGPCAHGSCDLYLTATAGRGEAPSLVTGAGMEGFDPRGILYYGGGRAADLLAQQQALGAGRRYDAILVLTDDGSLDLADDRGGVGEPEAPVYMIHLGGRLAPGYDDRTLRAVRRRGGGAFPDAQSALADLAAAGQGGAATYAGRGGGYRWSVEKSTGDASGADPCAAAGPFPRLAAARLLSVAERGAHGLEALDALHRVAKACAVVTPYSSMIVLVDDAQREALRRAEAEKDRFDRRVESGEEPVAGGPDLTVTGTPEPEEWLLLGLGALMLLWMAVQARRGALRGAPA